MTSIRELVGYSSEMPKSEQDSLLWLGNLGKRSDSDVQTVIEIVGSSSAKDIRAFLVTLCKKIKSGELVLAKKKQETAHQ